tara:strand:+ start:706 stop:900 length:195 start_codon:yes stop_codon:yes gene_type:complete
VKKVLVYFIHPCILFPSDMKLRASVVEGFVFVAAVLLLIITLPIFCIALLFEWLCFGKPEPDDE